jgi:hypothetical protein
MKRKMKQFVDSWWDQFTKMAIMEAQMKSGYWM